MQNVEFSIILPVYNAELYLKECLDSIVQQKFSSWELILIDDGSTDGSKNIYQNYADNEKMKIYMKENSGVSAARNLGISYAKGKYILFLDADDLLEGNALTIISEDINSDSNVDLILYDYYVLFNETLRPAKKNNRSGDYIGTDVIEQLLSFSVRQSQWYSSDWYGNMRPVWGKCFKKSVIDDNKLTFKEGLKYGEDMAFVLSYLLNSKHVKITSHCFYIHRNNVGSVMHRRTWQGPEQGEIYFETVEKILNDRLSENILRDLWLETAENDWALICYSNMSFRNKYVAFSKLMNSKLYRRFSVGNKNECSSEKQYIYCLCIRYHLTFILLILSYIRSSLHANRVPKY